MMMSEKHEIFIAKLIALILIILTLWEINAYGASRESIITTFMNCNKKLSREQAENFTEIIYRAGAKYHVSTSLIASIIVCESNAKPRAISKTGDYGLMQIHYNAHKRSVKSREELFDPEINIFLGTQIFASCRAKSWSLSEALKRYSGGNKKYAKKVIRTLRTLNKK